MNSITNDSYFPGVQCGPYRTTQPIPGSLRFPLPALAITAAAVILLLWNAKPSLSGVEAAPPFQPFVSVQAPEPPRSSGGLNGGISLGNGTEIKSRLNLDGHGELTIKNGTSYDAIVNLVEPGSQRLVRSFYVQSRRSSSRRASRRELMRFTSPPARAGMRSRSRSRTMRSMAALSGGSSSPSIRIHLQGR